MYMIEFGWVGLCSGVGRGYTGVALKGGGVQMGIIMLETC
jgi:hypothetical protein